LREIEMNHHQPEPKSAFDAASTHCSSRNLGREFAVSFGASRWGYQMLMQELAIMRQLTAAVLFIAVLLFPPALTLIKLSNSIEIGPREAGCVA